MRNYKFHQNGPRVWIRCVVCEREVRVPASSVKPPRASVPLCGSPACHSAWKMAIANSFDVGSLGLQ